MAEELTPPQTTDAPTGRLSTAFETGRARALEAYDRAAGWADGAAVRLDLLKVRLLPTSALAGRVQPEEDNESWRFLLRPALLGFAAITSVVVGCSLTSSPFKLSQPGAWYFGVPRFPGQTSDAFLLFGLVAVYGGLILLMRVWYGLAKALANRPGVPVHYLVWTLALWTLPLLLAPPLFSRDVYSYAAQGEMVSRHLNPYQLGPFSLGTGPYPAPVDPLWGNTPAPYGPLFLIIDGALASLSLHHAMVTDILLRLLAVAGVALIAWCMPKLARSFGRDPGPVFTLAVLNPLVLLTLIGGAHNDAIMAGLLVAGVTAARLRHPAWGVVLCALAGAIKAPAFLGVVFVAWDWLGPGVSWRQRVRPLVTAGIITTGVMAALTVLSGLGTGWVGNLATPGTVRSWLAPATGVGMLGAGLAHVVGLGISQGGVLSVTRFLGLLLAAGATVYLLKESDRIGNVKALGLALLLFVILGPVVQPWYLTWGLVLLAPVATGRLRTVIIAFSVLSPFIGLPGGRTLVHELFHYDPLSVAAALVLLLGVLLWPLGRWTSAWRDPERDPAGWADHELEGFDPTTHPARGPGWDGAGWDGAAWDGAVMDGAVMQWAEDGAPGDDLADPAPA